MILLQGEHLKKHYGLRKILDDVALSIAAGDKIGVIGINGTGKSTLLRLIAGVEESDEAHIAHFTYSRELLREYLPQNPDFDAQATVLEQIFRSNSPLMQLLAQYEAALQALEADSTNPALTDRLLALSAEMDRQDAWQLESEAKAILNKLGIQNYSAKIGTLSGGQKKRVALAGALIRPCNLLILDEPTNHLDAEAIRYLEGVLQNKNCALLMVTHDRYFLDRICNRIIEVDQGKLYEYAGNYEYFLEQKELRRQQTLQTQEKLHALYRQELEWMRKGVEARRTKQKARIERFYQLEDSLQSQEEIKMELSFAGAPLGKKIFVWENLSKSFGSQVCLQNFSYIMTKTDRIGIVGANGLGKTTLLNILCGKITDYSGTLEIGETVKVGYYTQDNQDLPEDMRLIDFIREKGEYLRTADGSVVSASKMLERFLFSPAAQYGKIEKLSGGEKRRLLLLSVLMTNANVLILDEPTNDLDIQTLQILEDFLDHFAGPVIAVSHDRYFLDRISEKIFAFTGNGHVEVYTGNYSDYLAREETPLPKESPVKKPTVRYQGEHKLKFSYQEKKEYETIEDDIAALEETLAQIDTDLEANASDFVKLNELMQKKDETEQLLSQKLDRWEYLSLLAEKIAAQSSR